MRRFLTWWLALSVGMLLMLGVAWLAALVANEASRYLGTMGGLIVMLVIVSALVAGWMGWAFGPTPPWFRKLVAKL